jgi:gliding motility-associated-like protein
LKKIVFLAVLALIIFENISLAQSYSNIEFVENKGQWHEKVKFKGEMSTGAFFLRNNGFTVVQHNVNDLKEIAAAAHGHSHGGNDGGHHDDSKSRKISSPAPQAPTTPTKELTLHSHAYEVKFLNAGNATIVPDKAVGGYNNYFIGNDPDKWASECKVFQAVTYQNIYPNIDVRYYTNNGQLKYDIIVRPGGDISRIAMQYDGVNALQLKNEELVIKTSVGEMRELAPYSYQVETGQRKEVATRFKISGNVVQFNVANYSKNSTLIIDPQLVFSTFTGSTVDNWGYTATYGPDGSFYAGGIVFGTGFPVSPGAFQTSFGGGVNEANIGPHDIGIIKFNPTGSTRVYATYIGGNGNEQPHSLVVDDQGNLIMGGRTNSANYPTRGGTFGTGGLFDIVLTKLNSTGTGLIGSRKLGGIGDDGVNIQPKNVGAGAISIRRNYGDDARSEVILDNAGNIYLASCTQSTKATNAADNFPTTPGAFQRMPGGTTNTREQDGVVIKASPDLSTILFSTYLGGNNDDAAFVLSLHPTNNNIYVGGSTASTNFPGTTNGAIINSTYQGGACAGFVTILSNDGSTVVKSTYIGNQGNDMLYGVQFDKFAFPYVMGTSSIAHQVINAPFSQPGGKQFISKLQPDLSAYVYSTIFGAPANNASPNISPTAFLVDDCENVYVSGWGGSINTQSGSVYPNSGTSGMTVTSDAIKSNTDGSDFYFFVLAKNAASQLYGSFFGQNGGATGEHVDGGTSRFDKQGVIYQALCANCGGGANFPTTPGVWSPNNGSSNCNLAAVKIAFNLAGISNSISPSINGVRDTSGCVPLAVTFTDTIALGQKYIWNFGDGSADTTTLVPTVKHIFNTVGSFQIRLISIDSNACNISDTAYATLRVRNDEAFLSFTSAKLPPCESTTYQFTNTSVAPPGQPFKNTSFRWDFGDNTPTVVAGPQPVNHTYAALGTYRVKLVLIDTTYCNAPDSLVDTIRIAPNVKAAFQTPPGGCAPYTAVFKNTSLGGQQFFWDFGDGTTSTLSNPTHLYPTPGSYLVKLKAVDPATCNIEDSTNFTITVSDKPTAAFTYTPTVPQENSPVTLFNSSIGAVRYKWDFGDGDTLSTSSVEAIAHIYNKTGTFNTCLVAINQFGCRDTTCQPVQAIVVPALDVPNAFTPNGDGINDKVFVRGFGIERMVWRIYNRWGTLVFQTSSQSNGWDGMYKGALQPKEVYNYVLSVEFSDGTKYDKKGDITLL